MAATADHDYCASCWEQAQKEVRIYNMAWPRGVDGRLLWNNLLNGEDTSSTWCFDVRYRESERIVDDVRLTWELNRLTWLIPIAVHGVTTHDRQAIDYVAATVRSFLEADQVGFGARWNSMIELAMQSLSLIVLDATMSGEEEWRDLSEGLTDALRQRYRWLEALPSLHSSANNHRLAELAAMSAIAACLPDNRGDLEAHLQHLGVECRKQFGEDGFNAELSFDYHVYSLDLILSVIQITGSAATALLKDQSVKICATTAAICGFAGLWPSVADSDEACLISSVVTRKSRPGWLPTLVDLGQSPAQGAGATDALQLRSAGYTFIKKSSGSHELLVLADHGELGYGSIAAHAHADTLGLWLWVDGEAWLSDGGTYSYHSNTPLRNELRSSAMHNCVTINGASTSVPDGPFLWNPKRCASRVAGTVVIESDVDRIDMSATVPKLKGIRPQSHYSRSISVRADGIEVLDDVEARSAVWATQHYIFAPGFELSDGQADGSVSFVRVGGGRMTFLIDEDAVEATIDEVSISGEYGSLVPTLRLNLTNSSKEDRVAILTRIEIEPAGEEREGLR